MTDDASITENDQQAGDPAAMTSERARAYWRANLSLLGKLLAIWFMVSFGFGILFRPFLDTFQLFGFKIGFWFAQQGSIFVFVALIFVYAARMKKLDREFGVDD